LITSPNNQIGILTNELIIFFIEDNGNYKSQFIDLKDFIESTNKTGYQILKKIDDFIFFDQSVFM